MKEKRKYSLNVKYTVCVCVHACVCVCVYQTDSLINLSLCVGPVDLGCYGDGNRAGPGNGL